MFDAATFNAGAQARADFLGQHRCDFLAQKARYPGCVSAQDGLAAQGVVQRAQDLGALEQQVGGVLNLTNAPVVGLRCV